MENKVYYAHFLKNEERIVVDAVLDKVDANGNLAGYGSTPDEALRALRDELNQKLSLAETMYSLSLAV